MVALLIYDDTLWIEAPQYFVVYEGKTSFTEVSSYWTVDEVWDNLTIINPEDHWIPWIFFLYLTIFSEFLLNHTFFLFTSQKKKKTHFPCSYSLCKIFNHQKNLLDGLPEALWDSINHTFRITVNYGLIVSLWIPWIFFFLKQTW